MQRQNKNQESLLRGESGEAIRRLAGSGDAQQLVAMLRSKGGVQQAAQAAAKGCLLYTSCAKALKLLMFAALMVAMTRALSLIPGIPIAHTKLTWGFLARSLCALVCGPTLGLRCV